MNLQARLSQYILEFMLLFIPFYALLNNFSNLNYLLEISLFILFTINLNTIISGLKNSLRENIWAWAYLAFVILVGVLQFNGIKNLIFGIKYEVFYLICFLGFSLISKNINFKKAFDVFVKSSIVALIGSLLIYITTNNEALTLLGYRMDWSTFYLGEGQAMCQKIQDSNLCRFQGFLSSPNHYGLHLLFLIFLIRKKLADIGLGFIAVLTFSRSSLLSIFVFLWSKMKKNIRACFSVIGFVLLLIYSLYFASGSTFEHFYNFTNSIMVPNSNWILGNGLDFSGPASRLSNLLIPESHFVQIYLNTGIIGFALFSRFFYGLYQKSKNKDKNLSILLLSLLIPMFFLHPLEDSVLSFTVFAYLGLAVALDTNS